METKHTPGPWRTANQMSKYAIFGPASDNLITGWRGDKTCKLVAEVIQHFKQDDENQANARLIAAAPEMLEALKRLLRHVLEANKDYEVTTIAEAAIAKAEGKE